MLNGREEKRFFPKKAQNHSETHPPNLGILFQVWVIMQSGTSHLTVCKYNLCDATNYCNKVKNVPGIPEIVLEERESRTFYIIVINTDRKCENNFAITSTRTQFRRH